MIAQVVRTCVTRQSVYYGHDSAYPQAVEVKKLVLTPKVGVLFEREVYIHPTAVRGIRRSSYIRNTDTNVALLNCM